MTLPHHIISFMLVIIFCRKLLKTCQEAKYWITLECRIPAHVDIVMERYPGLILLYRNVEMVMLDYNHIIACKCFNIYVIYIFIFAYIGSIRKVKYWVKN